MFGTGLEGKVAILTGAAGGIGRGVARALAQEGVNVVAVDIDAEGNARIAEECKKLGVEALPLTVDLESVDEIQGMVDTTVERFGQLDILIQAAAMLPGKTPLLDVTQELWDKHSAINLRAIFFGIQAASRVMIPQKSGVIVNFSSISAYIAFPPKSLYEAAKAGVSKLTSSLAVELAPHGIRVNAIAPGLTIHPRQIERLGGPEVVKRGEANIPLGRAGTPEDMASVVVFLCSDASQFMTGQTVIVDGGFLLRG